MADTPRSLPRKPVVRQLPVLVIEEGDLEDEPVELDAEAYRAYAEWLRRDAPTVRRDIGAFARSGPPG